MLGWVDVFVSSLLTPFLCLLLFVFQFILMIFFLLLSTRFLSPFMNISFIPLPHFLSFSLFPSSLPPFLMSSIHSFRMPSFLPFSFHPPSFSLHTPSFFLPPSFPFPFTLLPFSIHPPSFSFHPPSFFLPPSFLSFSYGSVNLYPYPFSLPLPLSSFPFPPSGESKVVFSFVPFALPVCRWYKTGGTGGDRRAGRPLSPDTLQYFPLWQLLLKISSLLGGSVPWDSIVTSQSPRCCEKGSCTHYFVLTARNI